MKQTKTELEFRNFMKIVYPKVPTDSMQYKATRIAFYAGAFTMMLDCGSMDVGLKKDMDFAYLNAKNGFSPEEALHDLIEGRE